MEPESKHASTNAIGLQPWPQWIVVPCLRDSSFAPLGGHPTLVFGLRAAAEPAPAAANWKEGHPEAEPEPDGTQLQPLPRALRGSLFYRTVPAHGPFFDLVRRVSS